MDYLYYAGLDLGQSADYSALAIIEQPVWTPATSWISWPDLPKNQRELYRDVMGRAWEDRAPPLPPLWLRTLHRWLLGTPYPAIVADVLSWLNAGSVLVVDATGVGAGIVDMFRYDARRNFPMYPVVITAGQRVERNHVPKKDLIGAAQVLIQTGRITVAEQSKYTDAWLNEMQAYAFKQADTGHVSYNARGDSDHDDLVLATALACWYRNKRHLGEQQYVPVAAGA